MKSKEGLIVIGHRGSRGLKPENTIPAFLKAIKLGARGLEMDLYITRDEKVVVTHDATISADLCLTPEGDHLDKEKSKRLRIYDLNLKDIKPFDCGSEPNPDFPEQQNTEAHIPMLREVVEAIERVEPHGKSIHYYLEFKSAPSTDHINHPEPAVFAKKVVETLFSSNIQHQSLLMTFDKRCLREVRKIAPEIKIGLSIAEKDGLEKGIEELGFFPDAILPLYKEVNDALMSFVKEKDLEIFPWTVNEAEEIKQVLAYDINGLITDYPDRALKIIEKK